jgi:predicted phage terminase large subunit-like protein
VLFDDVEDQELVLTRLRRERLIGWLQSDIAKLGEHDLNMDGIGTVLHPEGMLATLLKNPGFRHSFYQAVTRFADGDDQIALWGEWRNLVLNLDDADRLVHAHQFYLAHEAVMLDGAGVLWPETQSYEYLMLDRVIYGETAFWTERMNSPMQDTRFMFDMENAIYFHTYDDALARQDGKLVHFLDMTALAGYWDPTPDRANAAGDYTCFSVGMKDKYGYIYLVDSYCEQEPSTDAAMNAIVDMIWHWRIPQIGIEINSFASLLTNELRRKIDEKAKKEQQPWDVSFVPIKNMKNKILRIKTLEPLVQNGWLAFAETLPAAFFQMFKDFIPIEHMNKFDDAPDCAEGLCRVLSGLFDRRAAF